MLLINDLAPALQRNRERVDAAIDRVLCRGWLVLGPEVEAFERAFAEFHAVRHCVGVANGTDALELALRAVGIGPGDRVATVANAGGYATTAIRAIAADPRFMDVDFATRVVSVAEVERALADNVRAVIVTHLYGLAAPGVEAIARRCEAQGVPLIEDCAQAHGATIGGRRVGSFGTASCFSFYPTKNLGALGDGGAVVTNDAKVADTVRLLRQYGWTRKYTVELAGARNSRLDELQAAVLGVLLPRLDEVNARRRAIAARYSDEIRHPHVQVPPVGGAECVAHLYVVTLAQRDALRKHLSDSGIGTDVHYPVPDHLQPAFKVASPVALPVTERLAREVLTLPCYPEMADAQVGQVIAAVNGWRA